MCNKAEDLTVAEVLYGHLLPDRLTHFRVCQRFVGVDLGSTQRGLAVGFACSLPDIGLGVVWVVGRRRASGCGLVGTG